MAVKRFDLSSLFDRNRARRFLPNPPFPDELEATAVGTKPICRLGTSLETLVDSGLARAALSRSLAITLRPETARWPGHPRYATAFVARPEELWRVPALLRLREGVVPWPREQPDDPYESRLLGYSPAQTERWHAHVHQHDTFCFYMLLDREDRARIARLGNRCLGTLADVERMTFYYVHAHLRRDAYQRIPAGRSLGRLMLHFKILRGVVGDPRLQRHQPRRPLREVRVIRPTRKQARIIVTHQYWNVEILTARGWR